MNGLVGGMIKTKPRNASGGPRNRTPDERLKRSRTQMPGIAYVYPPNDISRIGRLKASGVPGRQGQRYIVLEPEGPVARQRFTFCLDF